MTSTINALFNSSGTIQEMSRELQEEQEDILGQTEIASAPLAAASDTLSLSRQAISRSTNMMSRNFSSAERSESKYINATLRSFSVDKQLQNQATSRVTALLNCLGGVQGPRLYEGVGSKGGVPEATIQLAMKRIRDAEAHEASERNLEEMKEGIEQRAQEAAVPKDENGKPIEGTEEAAPMPEISGSNPASAPAQEVSVAPAPGGAVVATPAPEISTPSAPSTVSIDITV